MALVDYNSSDESLEENEYQSNKSTLEVSSFLRPINSTPEVEIEQREGQIALCDPHANQLYVNPKISQCAPLVGPVNPFKSSIELAKRNTLIGYVEKTNFDDFNFENQRKTFQSYGYKLDQGPDKKSVFEKTEKRPGDKRKKLKNLDGTDVENYTGPWAIYEDEQTVAIPNEEDMEYFNEIREKREAISKRRKGDNVDMYEPVEAKTTLHIEETHDYQGRSFMVPPYAEHVNLKSSDVPTECRIPRKLAMKWPQAHKYGVSVMRLFPKSGHLLVSGGRDKLVRLCELYGDRRMIRSYYGHRDPIKDISFNIDGTQMLTSAYDKYVKLWDIETGSCIREFTNKHVANVVKFNPEIDKQHLFLAGCTNKKILCYDVRSGEVVQIYDRHLGAINSITFFDNNKRFLSTAEDRSLRMWEWNIPVDFKQLSDSSMHSMPSVALSPNGKWLVGQSLDNQIVTYNLSAGFKKTKKLFRNEMVAGTACQIDFSPDSHYLVSGDGNGNICSWDFKTSKPIYSWSAHKDCTTSVLWLPHEQAKIVSASKDGDIKLWE